MLTVKLLVFDGYFAPAENRIDSKGKLIAMLLGGPIASLILVIVLALLKFGGISWESEILATGSIEFFLDFALFCNAYLFVFSVLPVHYLFGEIRGMATDGLQILNAIKHKEKP